MAPTLIRSFPGTEAVPPQAMRRNLAIECINLASLKGRDVAVRTAVLHNTGICAPCSRMEDAFVEGGYAAVRGHGGWCAEVITPGAIRLGDGVSPVD